MNRLKSLLANKHTSGAALLYALSTMASHSGGRIAIIWFPSHASQIEDTVKAIAKWLEDLSFVWGMLAATDSSQLGQVKQDVQDIKTGNTDQFLKAAIPTNEPPKV